MAEDGSLLVADDDEHLADLLGLASPENIPSQSPPVQALLDAQDSLEWQGRPLRPHPACPTGPLWSPPPTAGGEWPGDCSLPHFRQPQDEPM
ncbi:hypothetical protein [Streptomyces sp. NPDC058678]|uniref:hypothetical protein n=1 Tax=Streptomyces sp. NPDC058678 TaxID=3346595 RepID=UPI00365B13E9